MNPPNNRVVVSLIVYGEPAPHDWNESEKGFYRRVARKESYLTKAQTIPAIDVEAIAMHPWANHIEVTQEGKDTWWTAGSLTTTPPDESISD